ncbi:MAG: hypothetical protein KC502_10620 [Myxococcales bacterium]|nr:hypothetical protein [Myxococcales bacterium]
MAHVTVIGQFEGRRIARMLRQMHLGALMPGERFEVDGWQEDGWVTVRFVLTDDQRSYPVEARLHAQRHGQRTADAKAMLLDLLGHFFGLYLTEGRAPFTGPKWEEVDMAGVAVFVRGQEQHAVAEAQADALLRTDSLTTAAQVTNKAPVGSVDPAEN